MDPGFPPSAVFSAALTIVFLFFAIIVPCLQHFRNVFFPQTKEKKLKNRGHKKTKKSPFPLQKLPALPLELIASLMEKEERLCTALTSTKTENMLMSLWLPRVTGHTILICDQGNGLVADIIIGDENQSYFVVGCGAYDQRTPDHIRVWTVPKWCTTNRSTIYNTRMVYNKIAKLFPTDRLDLCIGRAKTRHIERILSASEFEKWRMASVKERIEKTAMDLIMSNVKTGRTLTCARDAQFPVNYHHDKAFCFEECEYYNAHWVRLHHLLSMKRVRKVTLVHTNLTPRDLNFFIRHCIQSEGQVCYSANIILADIGVDMDALMYGFLYVEDSNLALIMKGMVRVLCAILKTAMNGDGNDSRFAYICVAGSQVFCRIYHQDEGAEYMNVLEAMKARRNLNGSNSAMKKAIEEFVQDPERRYSLTME
ncbi:hypothetical protein CRE_28867 [Caenorhabditis remanei]|uniref:Sdz-33 F-box domain-containing protein n=1 Tax=Caenorhabditis remanei TaxID=31234 RepID=E3MXJ8_CAERE|nr:hypothetical protein CRE_28867 [Caenorhabditis remanei]